MRRIMLFACLAVVLCSCGKSAPDVALSSLPLAMQSAYRAKMEEKKAVDPSHCSYALYDINRTGTPNLLVGWARNLEVYAYQNSELVHLGNIYNEPFANPNAPGIYTYGGFGTGAGGSVFFAINEKNELQIAPGEVHMSYLVSDLQSTYLVNDHAVSEEEYNASVDLHFNDETRIPLRAIP